MGLFLSLALLAREVRWYLVASRGPEELKLPSVFLRTLDGTEINLQSYLGTPLVVNLWATWCPPCRRELPMMVRVAEEGGTLFLFVHFGEDPEKVRAFLREAGVGPSRWVRFFLEDESVVRALYTVGLPTTLFFDTDGTMRSRHLGEMDEKTLRSGLEVLR